MSDPIEFYRTFRSLLHEWGVEGVLTSGMACVEYGLQQNTKDTDWIVAPADIQRLVTMFLELERGVSGANWRISYRGLFGAPLDQEYLAGGWTSHIVAFDRPESAERHLDFFGQPPRVDASWQTGSVAGIASRDVVARMKKTDRPKDWPLVYQQAWKTFYRSWQRDRVGEWPTSEPFAQQHQCVCDAVRKHGLPPAPLGTAETRQAVYDRGRNRAASLLAATPEEMEAVAVPLGTILPA